MLNYDLWCFTLLICSSNLASFTQGSDALVLKDRSYASSLILCLDILEGIAPIGGPQSATAMDVEREPSAPATEVVQVPLQPVTAMPLSRQMRPI